MDIDIDLVENTFVDFGAPKNQINNIKKQNNEIHGKIKSKSKPKPKLKPKLKIKSKSKSKSKPKLKKQSKTKLHLNFLEKEPNERKQRGLSQKIFMIEHRKNSEFDMEFDVMGTTKNVYTVKINKTPTCSCPDHTTRHRRCKHIFFIMRRIMKIDEDIEESEKFTNSQLKTMIKNMPNVFWDLVVTDDVKNKYGSMKNKKTNDVVEMRNLDDVCCICFDDLDNGDEIDYCKYNCGKPIHKECFDMYCAMKQQKCLICGNEWIVEATDDNSYINLA